MLTIIADEIIMEGRTVARFDKGAWPTLRDRVEAIIEGAEPDMISETDHGKAIDEARDEAFAQGKDEARQGFKAELEAAKDKAYDEGYDAGRAAALVDIEQAQDAVRVEALLQAVSAAHDGLFAITCKRYPAAKLGELKSQAIKSLSEIRRAVQAWRAPNGA